MITTIALVIIVLVWTVGREVLLEKYASPTHPNHMRNSLLIVLGCVVCTLGLFPLFF